MRNCFLILSSLMILAGCASKDIKRELANEARQEFIGSTVISNGRDFDAIRVDGRKISAVKLCAVGDDLDLNRVELTFGNGTVQQLHMKAFVQQGTCTNWKDLEGEVRNVAQVRIWASSDWDPRGRKTRVDFYGRNVDVRDETDLIGTTVVSNGRDFDAIRVDGRKISSVKLCAVGDDLELDRVEVTFGNGTSQVLRMRALVKKGTCTAWKDLEGEVRNVTQVRIWASSDWDWQGRKTRVNFYGKHNEALDNKDLIGTTVVNNGRDFDAIKVDGRKISGVKLCAVGDDLDLDRVEVTFGNGTSQVLRMKSFVQKGTCTAWKDLEGEVRNVTQIRIWASSDWDPRGRKTRVNFYGRHVEVQNESELIGTTVVSNGRDFDVIRATGQRIKEVRVCVKGDDFEADRIELTFGNGQVQVLRVREFIQKGTCTAWKDLEGNARNVSLIRIWGSSDWDPRGRQTRVNIYGR